MTRRPCLFKPELIQTGPEAAPAPPVPAVPEERPKKASTREGKRVVTAYFAPEALKQLRKLAAGDVPARGPEETTIQALMEEAVNDLFAKYGLTRLA